MKRTTLFLLPALLAFGLAQPSSKKRSVSAILIQMEHEWSQAGMKKDLKTLDRIMADDWVSIDLRGNPISKALALDAVRSAKATGQDVQLGTMKVRVFGTTAIVNGVGSDNNGRYAWLDVFIKRDGRWQAVASQSTKLEK